MLFLLIYLHFLTFMPLKNSLSLILVLMIEVYLLPFPSYGLTLTFNYSNNFTCGSLYSVNG